MDLRLSREHLEQLLSWSKGIIKASEGYYFHGVIGVVVELAERKPWGESEILEEILIKVGVVIHT